MPKIPIVEIVVLPTRQRKDMGSSDELQELALSMAALGQLNPVIIDENNVLMAGERRLRAALLNEWTEIEVKYFESLSPIDKKKVELDENRRRKQLSWQEEAAAIAEIHEMMVAEKSSWTASDTAREIGVSKAKVSEDLSLAEALTNKRVAGRPSRRGAIQTMMREEELDLVRELASRRASSLGLEKRDNATNFANGIIYNEDCRTVLSRLEENSIDLVVADPPWGISLDVASQWTRKWTSSFDDSETAVREMLVEVFPHLFRVLKPSCHIYLFYPIQATQWWFERLTDAGFIVRQRPLVWFKTGQPSITDTYTSFLPCYESILWGFKPGDGDVRRLFNNPIPEGFGIPRPPGTYHVNEKPTDLLDRLVEASSSPEEVVLDPWCGGGSTPVSAFGLNRYFIGIELDEISYDTTKKRLEALEHKDDSPEEEDDPERSGL